MQIVAWTLMNRRSGFIYSCCLIDFLVHNSSFYSFFSFLWQITDQDSECDSGTTMTASSNLHSVFYAESYHPIQAGSIDGTDILPHDHAVYRASLCSSAGLCTCPFPLTLHSTSPPPVKCKLLSSPDSDPNTMLLLSPQMILLVTPKQLVIHIAQFLLAAFLASPLKRLFTRYIVWLLPCGYCIRKWKKVFKFAYFFSVVSEYCFFIFPPTYWWDWIVQVMSKYGHVKNLRLVRDIGTFPANHLFILCARKFSFQNLSSHISNHCKIKCSKLNPLK